MKCLLGRRIGDTARVENVTTECTDCKRCGWNSAEAERRKSLPLVEKNGRKFKVVKK